jgi:3-phenylpropionate/trans-cinnamate dioxygenase ferredoxin reductase component
MAETTHVIVGGGLAGAKAAEALRAEGSDGRIVLVGAEAERPYERPPLSKAYLRGEAAREAARVHSESFYDDNAIELRLGLAVEAVDRDARTIVLADGERIRFDTLLLATGSEPRRLTLPGAELPGIHYLRSLPDADALRDSFRHANRLVVIGGGWIGAEVAASARQLGLEVAIVEPAPVLLEHALGRTLGGFYGELHRDQGVELHTGIAPWRFEGGQRVERVVLHNDRTLDCDIVLVGIGAVPRTELATQAGLLVENGVLTTTALETSASGIFAAGDVASAIHPFYNRRLRVEHWANALNQPGAAARSMLGKPVVYDRLPYFFSDQYDVGMEFVGDAGGSDDLVVRGDSGEREFVAFWLATGRVVAAMAVNVWDVIEDAKRLITSRAVVEGARLADPSIPLETLAPAVEAAP